MRWTIGEVSEAGFECLRLSIWSAWRLFGDSAQYAVSVNSLPLWRAIHQTGELPCKVKWLNATHLVPSWLRPHVSDEMAEGVAWKLAPVRVFPTLHEISLDNDLILWSLPAAMRNWLACEDPDSCLMAADLQSASGQFAAACKHRALNSGIRGLPPNFDLESRLESTLVRSGIRLQSELDEQGLQAAVLSASNLFVVGTEDVSICSPFPNHQEHLGRCGVHFVGLNRKTLPWLLQGRGAHEPIRELWNSYADDLAFLTGAPTNSLPTSKDLQPAGALP